MEKHMNTAVITGGSGTLGQAIASALSAPDWNILAPSSSDLDVRDPVAVAKFFQPHATRLLVCAAGVIRDAPLARTGGADWDELLAVNYQGSLACARAVLPGMIELGGGHIIFISSFSALQPPAGQVAYATAKAALLGLTRDLACSHGSRGIRVNAILPGFIDSRMTETVTSKRRVEILADHTLGQFNTPREVGNFIRHLHHHLPHTSGQVFQLDSRIG
jgi:3-oxoacyl-[acyl-carrier protein] reductase